MMSFQFTICPPLLLTVTTLDDTHLRGIGDEG